MNELKVPASWDMDVVLHVLRNPHGFREDVVRRARLDAADRIEAHLRLVEKLRAAIDMPDTAPETEICPRCRGSGGYTYSNGLAIEGCVICLGTGRVHRRLGEGAAP